MSYFTLSRWFPQRHTLGHRTCRCGAPPLRPCLEVLEHRNLPSTLVVTNTSDTGGYGDGSLRGEILAASSGDQILFDPSLSGQTITLNNTSALFLDKDLTIQGLGADQLTIRGTNGRIFDISRLANDTITGLTLSNGNPGGAAGAIFNSGSLTLNGVTLSGNTASIGGAIENAGTMALSFVTLTNNSATTGGAIYNAGVLTIDSCQITGNTAKFGSGGGIYNATSGNLTLSFTILSGNSASTGGGISNDGTMTLSFATLSSNTASFFAGGIYNAGTLSITVSYLVSNSAGFFGGGIYNDGTLALDTCLLTSSTAGYFGGGVYNNGDLTVSSSLVTNNTAAIFGGGIYSLGTLALTSDTFSGNSPDHVVGEYTDGGGNIFG